MRVIRDGEAEVVRSEIIETCDGDADGFEVDHSVVTPQDRYGPPSLYNRRANKIKYL